MFTQNISLFDRETKKIEIEVNKIRHEINQYIGKLIKQSDDMDKEMGIFRGVRTDEHVILIQKTEGLKYVLKNTLSMETCKTAWLFAIKQYRLDSMNTTFSKEVQLLRKLIQAYGEEEQHARELSDLRKEDKRVLSA